MLQRQNEDAEPQNDPIPTQGKPPEPKGPLDDPDPAKPEPKDPDADCMGCKPITKISKKSGSTTTVFGLCDDDFDKFNTGAGIPTAGPGCSTLSSNKTSKIFFQAGAPGWQLTAKIKDCTYPPPATNTSKTDWEIGFIQTLESATFGATYDNNTFIKISNSNARDALVKPASAGGPPPPPPPAPWYDDRGNPFGPQDYPGTLPTFSDTPNVGFNITHPSNNQNYLRSVCMKAKFHIWLIINSKKKPNPTVSDVDFFYNWSVDMDHSYTLTGEGAHPCNITQWKSSGSLTKGSKGSGKGSATPVWDTPVAKTNEVTDTTVKANPCSASGGTDAPKEKPKDTQNE
jgi:hypothetical protein